jgi:hypothetical protein
MYSFYLFFFFLIEVITGILIKGILRPSHVCFICGKYSSNWNRHRLHSEPFSAKRKTQRMAPPLR